MIGFYQFAPSRMVFKSYTAIYSATLVLSYNILALVVLIGNVKLIRDQQ